MNLKYKQNSIYSPFNLRNNLEQILPKESLELQITFEPIKEGEYNDQFQIFDRFSTSISMIGKGKKPNLKIVDNNIITFDTALINF